MMLAKILSINTSSADRAKWTRDHHSSNRKIRFGLSISESMKMSHTGFLLILLLGLGLAASTTRAAAHFQRLKSFGFADQMGQNPYAPLMQGSNGMLYGTTFNGGINNAGTVFRANKD